MVLLVWGCKGGEEIGFKLVNHGGHMVQNQSVPYIMGRSTVPMV